MNSDHIEAAAGAASAVGTAATKWTYGASGVAVVAGTTSASSVGHQVLWHGLSIGEWCALGGLMLGIGTFALNAWDKFQGNRERKRRMELREAENAARLSIPALNAQPSQTGDL